MLNQRAAGRSLARQQGRELTVGTGDAVFIDPGGGAMTPTEGRRPRPG